VRNRKQVFRPATELSIAPQIEGTIENSHGFFLGASAEIFQFGQSGIS